MSYYKNYKNLNEFININYTLLIDIINNINEYSYISLLIRFSIYLNKPLKTFEELLKIKDEYLILIFSEFTYKINNTIKYDINKILTININNNSYKLTFNNINYLINQNQKEIG